MELVGDERMSRFHAVHKMCRRVGRRLRSGARAGPLTRAAVLFISIALLSGSIHASIGGEDDDPDGRPAALLWEESQADAGVPLEDRDHNYIADIEQSYGCVSHDYRTDMDRDGMADYWENMWVKHPEDGIVLDLRNTEKMDAFEDPDDDGYDYDGDGIIEGTEDRVTNTYQCYPTSPAYDRMSVETVLALDRCYDGVRVCLGSVLVMEVECNMSLKRDYFGREVTIWVASSELEPREQWLEVRTDARSHRPMNLRPVDTSEPLWHGFASWVNVQGVVRFDDSANVFIEVRGTEQFTNLLEYQFRFLVGPQGGPSWERWYNQTNPFIADTDGDGMKDGWEAFHGSWRYEFEGYVVWEGGPNPTCGGDAGCDPDGDGLSFLDEYALGTDPLQADSDADGMVDDWEIAMGLDPRRSYDAYTDPDRDGFPSLQEYLLGTDPKWGGSHP